MSKKWVHIIGIAGSATSSIAVMFKNLGYKVTGSDKGFFPPVSDYLKKNDIKISPGFKKERLTENENHPDLVVVQGTKGDKNVEFVEAKRLKLKIQNYTEVVKEFIIVQESIVVVGSYGKTTTTALLVNIFKKAGIDISYMYGGLNVNFEDNIQAKDKNTKYSIVEGDEYLTSMNDKTSKFFYYSPKYVVINGLEHDHVDLFPTLDKYLMNFKRLIEKIPSDGIIFANIDNQNVQKVIAYAKCKVITFSGNMNLRLKPDWYLLSNSKPLPTIIKNPMSVRSELQIIPFERKILGSFNERNILAAAIVASEFGIDITAIQKGINSFKGIKRRLEIRKQIDNRLVIDDFGSTPAKAFASIVTIKEEFPTHYLVTVFEPNAGNRDFSALNLYSNVFSKSDLLILPKFSVLPKSKDLRFTEEEFYNYLVENHVNIEYIPIDTDVIMSINNELEKRKKVVVLFLGSHSFRGIINAVCKNFKKKKKRKNAKRRK